MTTTLIELLGGQCDGERLVVNGHPFVVQKLQLDPMSARAMLDEGDPSEYVETTTLSFYKVGQKHLNGLTYYRLSD
jgi:hypothetical protein